MNGDCYRPIHNAASGVVQHSGPKGLQSQNRNSGSFTSSGDRKPKDQHISIAIAKASREIAVESKRDSSSMKTIAAVTMFFLPGTFVASLFATLMF